MVHLSFKDYVYFNTLNKKERCLATVSIVCNTTCIVGKNNPFVQPFLPERIVCRASSKRKLDVVHDTIVCVLILKQYRSL